MSTIMMKSFADSWGLNWETDIAMKIDGDPITFAELKRRKIEKQERQLRIKRLSSKTIIKPCFVWIFYINGFPYAGWWLYIKTLKGNFSIGFRDNREHLRLPIMRLFPCGFLPMIENFQHWAEAFAKAYHRPGKRKKQGFTLAWVTIKNSELVGVQREN